MAVCSWWHDDDNCKCAAPLSCSNGAVFAPNTSTLHTDTRNSGHWLANTNTNGHCTDVRMIPGCRPHLTYIHDPTINLHLYFRRLSHVPYCWIWITIFQVPNLVMDGLRDSAVFAAVTAKFAAPRSHHEAGSSFITLSSPQSCSHVLWFAFFRDHHLHLSLTVLD